MELKEAGGPDWPVVGGAAAAIVTTLGALLKVFHDRQKSRDEEESRDERRVANHSEEVFKQARELLEQQRIDMVQLIEERRRDIAELRLENANLRMERDRLWGENTGLRQDARRQDNG